MSYLSGRSYRGLLYVCVYLSEEIPPIINEGCSDHDVSTEESSLSEFSCTPEGSSFVHSTDTEVEGKEARMPAPSPDHIIMDVPFDVEPQPSTSTRGMVEYQGEVPFPPTPDQEELESELVVSKELYTTCKESLYFRENMVCRKQTKRLNCQQPKNMTGGMKQP